MDCLRCSRCSRSFKQKSSLDKHTDKCKINEDRSLLCHPCNCEYYSLKSFKSHLRNIHNLEDSYKCPHLKCGETFLLEFEYYDHVKKTHNKSNRFICEFCDHTFRANSILKKHELLCKKKLEQERIAKNQKLEQERISKMNEQHSAFLEKEAKFLLEILRILNSLPQQFNYQECFIPQTSSLESVENQLVDDKITSEFNEIEYNLEEENPLENRSPYECSIQEHTEDINSNNLYNGKTPEQVDADFFEFINEVCIDDFVFDYDVNIEIPIDEMY